MAKNNKYLTKRQKQYRIARAQSKYKVIWTNHVPEKYDYLFSANIPEDLK